MTRSAPIPGPPKPTRYEERAVRRDVDPSPPGGAGKGSGPPLVPDVVVEHERREIERAVYRRRAGDQPPAGPEEARADDPDQAGAKRGRKRPETDEDQDP